jgi:hypothetical protein
MILSTLLTCPDTISEMFKLTLQLDVLEHYLEDRTYRMTTYGRVDFRTF